METEHKTKLKKRMNKDRRDWIVEVKNKEAGVSIVSSFSSIDGFTFENVLHKIELDLMTNLNYGFTNPIEVSIREIENA